MSRSSKLALFRTVQIFIDGSVNDEELTSTVSVVDKKFFTFSRF
jgi:hypothetical protein